MNIRMLREVVLPAVLWAALAVVPLPAAGEGGAGADDPQHVAETLAKDLVRKMLRHENHGQRVALQPLDPSKFDHLDLGTGGLQRLYALLVESLGSEVQQSYEWVDPGQLKDIARMLEGQGDPKWFARYMEILRESQSQTPISISCKAGAARQGAFRLTCWADILKSVPESRGTAVPESRGTAVLQNLGTDSGVFSMSWAAVPVDPGSAIAFVAEDIVGYMQVESVPEVSVVDLETKSGTRLANHVGILLQDKINAIRNLSARVIDGEVGTSSYRVKGTIDRRRDRLVLRVELYSGAGDASLTSFSESMNWTQELRDLDGAADGPPVAGGECEAGSDPGERRLADEAGRKLKHWALLTERKLETGDYDYFLEVLVKAETYLADHCEWERVAKILDVAIAGLAKELKSKIEEDPRLGLEQLLNVEASAGKHLVLLRLRARAYEMLGDRRKQDRAYAEILAVAPDDPAVLLPILEAQDRIRVEIEREDDELALGLDGAKRSLVRRGLLSFGHDGGEGSAEFDTRFRVALQRWQASNGRVKTGYLTADQAQALMAAGRAAEEREQDDETFARAKAANTAAAYEAYLAEFPNGLHAAEAKRLLDAARAREDEARARKAAEAAEQALALEAGDRVLIERGLAAWKAGGGAVDGRFDESFRALLRSWQASKGHLDTGYLTEEQARALMDEGEAAEAQEKDDRAFERAKAVNTAEAYEAYLSEYPDGRHAAEARRLLEAIHVREDDAAFARAKQADTEVAYAAYLSQYPDGRHAAEARQLHEAARAREAAAAAEEALGLTLAERVLVERGLASRVRSGTVDGRFDERFRAALRSWQASNGHQSTGSPTRGQAEALMGLGREVEERERDDAAFRRAKAADTVASYTAYLEEFPNARHAAEAKERREAARVRETAAAGEKALDLTQEDRVLIERGLATAAGGGKADGRFDAAFRTALRTWQGRSGYVETGYLTREQSEELIAAGRKVDERKRDDEAFGRAKAADTVASYEAYLEEFPNGRHVAEARRRLSAIRAREEGLRKEREAERILAERMKQERAQCMVVDRSRLTEGSVFCDCSECPIMVVDKVGSATGKYLVTRAEWNACIEDRACGRFRRRGQADLPMDSVSLEKAQAYVKWLSSKTGKNYRLLNESEWSDDAFDPGDNEFRVVRNVDGTAGEGAASAGAVAGEARLGLSRSDRMRIQRALNARGFDAGVVDGVFGRRTRKALGAWQASNGYAQTGYMTQIQVESLLAAARERDRSLSEPGRRFRDCEGSWCPELVVVPAGSYMMGSPESEAGRNDDEGPRHRVTIAKPFAVGVTEVTRGEFGRFVRETGHSTGNACWAYEGGGEWKEHSGLSWRKPGFNQADSHPVVCVSWEDARAYVRWLSRETGKRYRLLSESEWEYVARGGTRTSRYWGEGETGQCAHANGADRSAKRKFRGWTVASCDDGYVRTAPVGSFAPNDYGLHDALGNVWEWVEDCRHDSCCFPL